MADQKVTEDERAEKEKTEFTFDLDDNLDPSVFHITIPLKKLVQSRREGQNVAHILGGIMLDMQIKALRLCSVIQEKQDKNGIIRPAQVPRGPKISVH
jgi:hypothetical protein